MKNGTRAAFLIFTLFSLGWSAALLTPAAARAQDGTTAYESAKKKLASLNGSEKLLARRDSWLSVIESFGTVYLEYPSHERADDALYMVGILYGRLYERSWVKADLTHAIEAFDRLNRMYPASNLADDALWEIGEIYRAHLSDPARASCYYRTLVDTYPSGDMRPKAEARLRELVKYQGIDCSPYIGETAKKGGTDKTTGTVSLLAVRTFNDTDHTRVVLDVSAPADFSHGRLKDAAKDQARSQIYVDLAGGLLKEGVKETAGFTVGQIRTITIRPTTGPLRITIDPAGSVTYKVFSLTNPNRIVIDVYGPDHDADKTDGNGSTTVDVRPTEKVTPHSIKVVVLDPGHGGKDPGAVGPTGYYEKTANLKIARYLKGYLEKELGLSVVMTREGDTYLDLKKRTAAANAAGADLFISIHNNASKSRSLYGVSTYYLAITSDRKALDVAARENDTTVERLTELDYILTDLMVSAKRNESSLLAKFIQEGMVNSARRKYDNILNVGVCQGPFWVLVGAQMPSILVECSYISNKREEGRLKEDAYLKDLAWGIYKGVEKYIRETDGARSGK